MWNIEYFECTIFIVFSHAFPSHLSTENYHFFSGKKNVLTRLEEAGDAVLANESGNQESEVARGKEAVDQGLYESNRSSTSSGSRS